ncbi:HEAT repeat domain-containing protein [Myxococcus stipitatus]|uniref:HEAT repeat domain-containing protein n=1 Tax=Myxococcus stipitatus TaxID=83455 RepID=UPI001F465F89|nr:HEAT repeat domain-containing protein [Myxococcus stipitatus]MCE9673504.1 HEAT repeat domain-containing protein [Myxococcus stipitatus]
MTPVVQAPPSTEFTFASVEVFGSRKVPKEKLLEVIGLPAPGTRIDKARFDFVGMLQASKKRLLETWKFALCRYSVIEYPGNIMRVTVDLVDEGDEWRMAFHPAPEGQPEDPGGLVAAWARYVEKLEGLRRTGAYPVFGAGQCQGIVCFGGFGHPELLPLEQTFVEGVPRHFDALVRVVREDRDEVRRMHAVMLLSYGSSREKLAAVLGPAVKDPSTGVRNEALRMLGAIQKDQGHTISPLEPVLEALWFPQSTDRNKAGWALVRIVETEGAVRRKQILDSAGEMLLQMAAMEQPTDSEPALKVLTLLAGRDLGDEGARRRWVEETTTRERGSEH